MALALRADQWLMVAVGGALAFVVYRLATNRPNESVNGAPIYQPGPGQIPVGLPTRESFGRLNAIGRDRPPGVMVLSRGQPYRGRVELSAPGAAGQPLARLAAGASNADVAAELARFGLQSAQVFTEEEVRRTDLMPLEQALVSPDPRGGSRWFEATWGNDTHVMTIPDRITLLFPTVERYRPRALYQGTYTPLAFR